MSFQKSLTNNSTQRQLLLIRSTNVHLFIFSAQIRKSMEPMTLGSPVGSPVQSPGTPGTNSAYLPSFLLGETNMARINSLRHFGKTAIQCSLVFPRGLSLLCLLCKKHKPKFDKQTQNVNKPTIQTQKTRGCICLAFKEPHT